LSARISFHDRGAIDESREERQDHEQQQDVFEATAANRNHVGDRIAQRQSRQRHDRGVDEGSEELVRIGVDDLGIDAEVPGQCVARAKAALLEADRGHDDHRHDEEDDQPQAAR